MQAVSPQLLLYFLSRSKKVNDTAGDEMAVTAMTRNLCPNPQVLLLKKWIVIGF